MQDTFYVEGSDAGGCPCCFAPTPADAGALCLPAPAADQVIARAHLPRRFRCHALAHVSPVEGLWIDEKCQLRGSEGVYTDFLRRFFETDELQVRFRPSYFPFTEPSARST